MNKGKIINPGKWKVTKCGDLYNKEHDYFIDKSRLTEPCWISHLQEKVWIDMSDFIPVYWEALRLSGVKEFKIKIY